MSDINYIAKVTPIVRENIRTGALATRTHGIVFPAKETLCGISIYLTDPALQYSVEPDDEPITCPNCKEKQDALS